jgi:hypothetical protein
MESNEQVYNNYRIPCAGLDTSIDHWLYDLEVQSEKQDKLRSQLVLIDALLILCLQPAKVP